MIWRGWIFEYIIKLLWSFFSDPGLKYQVQSTNGEVQRLLIRLGILVRRPNIRYLVLIALYLAIFLRGRNWRKENFCEKSEQQTNWERNFRNKLKCKHKFICSSSPICSPCLHLKSLPKFGKWRVTWYHHDIHFGNTSVLQFSFSRSEI